MFNFRPFEILNINASGNVYNYEVNNENSGEIFNKETIAWDARVNASISITKTTRLQLNGMYRSESLSGQGTTLAMYNVGAAFKQSFLKDKLNLTLNVRDLFNTGQRGSVIESSSFYSETMRKRRGQIFRLALSYKINNYKRSKRDDVQPDIGG